MSDHEAQSPDRQGRPAIRSPPHPAADLRFVRVEYADTPDRCTVQPRDPDPTERTTAWLTADRGDFLDLSTCQ